MLKKINVIGLGPGKSSFLTLEGAELIKKSSIIVGDERQIESIKCFTENKAIFILKKFIDLIPFLEEKKYMEIAVIVSGDTGFYSLLNYLKKEVSASRLGENFEYLNVIPGISSYQYLFSKLKKCWHEYLLMSLHGREINYIDIFKVSNKGLVLLTDNINTPSSIGKKLTENGEGNTKIVVGENLSYNNEKIYSFLAKDYDKYKEFSLNVVILEKGDI
ncbi:MAG: precorrin-6y C5,15-methyltransferase (decarboxylating) subunit CbiE [Fusobacteriaceae bacterium]